MGRTGRGPTRPDPWDGRADCLLFAHTAEATWGLEAWRLGGWEFDEKVNKFDERVLKKDNVAIAVCLKIDLGNQLLAQKAVLGSIFGSLEGQKNGHFERKMRDRTKVKKHVVRMVGSGRPRRVTRRAVRKVWVG